jgi:hypothetical protein
MPARCCTKRRSCVADHADSSAKLETPEVRDTATAIPISVPGTANSPWGGMGGSGA